MAHDSSTAPRIGAREQESFAVLPGCSARGLVLLCDHAANALPAGYGTLGLPPAQLGRHIAYDIGAAEVTRGLAAALAAPAVMTRYSRLLIDPNRGIDDPTLIMRLSDGAVIPGNRRLDAEERERRVRLYYAPYHQAVGSVIDACQAGGDGGASPALLSIHSFTESWKDRARPWHVGVLWDRDQRLSTPLLEALYAEGDLIVGDNEPYSGQLEGDCLWQHATCRGLPNALIEIRQDLIRDAQGQAAWAMRLARIVEKILPNVPARTAATSDRLGASAGAAPTPAAAKGLEMGS